ncbi:MAG: tetratricopeptide repeat protein, partial [Planctomycetota bacterium]|nr:tetratricopeptide repeat protein [Planctomycetota bacterium]
PDSPRALRAVADLAMEAGDRDQALAALRRILTTARDDAARRDAAGRILGMHRRSGLDQLLKEEEARAAEDPSAHYLLARAAMLRRRSTQAIRHLEALVRSDPTSELGRTDLARLYTETGKEEDAIRLYEELMQSRPASRGVWLRRLASLHTAERRKRDAVRCYEEVLDLTPDNAAVFAEVAGKLDALGESERALACVRQAIRLRPDEGDYRLQLADLLVAQGDEDSAREQVRLALASDDPGTTEGARSWIHADLVEHGGVHAEVARLRDVLARSPYDQESSAALIDLWVRELEYALALDLIGDRLAFDPANVALLRVRAKLLEELGRYDQAIADHGTLLRLPGVGQDAVQLDLARCALRFGDRGRADAALLGVSDRVAVSQLYEREGLTEQAIGVLEEALVLNPGDWGLKQRLVRMYQKNGQVAKALDVHRGILAVRGEDWDSLRAQIDLCAAAGDEEGIRDAGARMLALTAAPVAPEGETSGVKVRRAVSVQRREHRKLLQEVWELYADRSKQQAFLDLVVERLKETPADEELLALALQACAPATEVFLDEPVEIEFSQAVAFVDLVRERTLGATPLLLPAGHSEASWLRELDRHEERLVKADPELAMRRVGQLAAEDFGELSGKDLDERLELLRAQGEPHEVLEVLELGVRRFPEEDKYRSGLAIRLLHDGESEAALPHLEALLAALDQEGERTARRPDDPGAEGRHAKTLLKRVPDEFADQRTDELGLTLYRLTRPSPLRGDWLESRVPNALDVRVALARCCHDLGRTEEAVAWLDEVMPNHLEFTEWAASTSDLYREFGQDERADAIDAQVWQVVQGVQASPVLRAGRAWQVGTRAAVMRELGGIEDPVERYELTRLWTGTSAAWSREHAETIRGAFAARWGAVRGEDSPEARDAGLLLAELLGLEDRWDEAIEIQRQLVELEPSDQDARAMLASYLVRAERAGEALALLDLELEEARKRYEETGERPARVARRILGAGATANPSELQPRPLALEGLRDRAREMVDEYDRSLSMFPVAQGPDLTPLRVQIFKLAWMAKDYARAGQELRAINDENPQLVAYCQWETKAALDEARLGADGVGLYAVLYDKSPGDSNLVESYGKALEEAGQNEDAIAVYRKYVQAQGNQSHYTLDQIRGSLERLTGAEAALLEEELPEDLVAAVAADPKSARLRIALIERLLRRGRTESAVEHALALEKLAPHLAEVPPLVERALLLAGDEGGLLERWNQRLATTTAVQGRIELAVRLADRALAAGADAAELNDIFARAQLRGTFIEDDYTIASWWIINGFHDEARAQLLEDRKSGQEWYFSEIDAALALLPQAELTLESRFEPLLQTSPGDAVDAIERALFEHGDVTWAQLEPLCEEQSRGYHALYPAGFALYEGRHADAEALMVALALQDVRYKAQLPAAIRLATARGDHAAALSYLDRLEERYPTSDRRKIDTSLGPIGEAQLAGVTRANLLRELGQAGEADEVWRKTFGRTADSRRLGAHLALTVNLADLAAELLGDDQRDSLLRSRILRTTGDLEGELASLDTYLESVPGDDSEGNEQQTRRLMVLCELGRRDEARRELEARLVKDPGDVLAAKFLIHLTWEEGGADAVAAMLDEGSLDLRELDELPRWAAEFRQERGDLSGALAAYEIYAEMGEEWQRSNVARARADLLVRLGREDELVDLYLDGVSRSQALLLAAERLSQGGAAPELALSWRREAAALGLYSTVAQEVELRLEIGQQEEAHQTALAAAAGRASLNDLRSAYTLFAKHHDELRVELAADESDAAARARVALELAAGEHAAVLAGLER